MFPTLDVLSQYLQSESAPFTRLEIIEKEREEATASIAALHDQDIGAFKEWVKENRFCAQRLVCRLYHYTNKLEAVTKVVFSTIPQDFPIKAIKVQDIVLINTYIASKEDRSELSIDAKLFELAARINSLPALRILAAIPSVRAQLESKELLKLAEAIVAKEFLGSITGDKLSSLITTMCNGGAIPDNAECWLREALRDYEGYPLHVAAANGHIEVVKLLIASGAKVDQIDGTNGQTPLIKVIEQGNANAVEVAKVLLHLGASVNGPNERTRPLHVAIAKGNDALARELLNRDAHVEAKDEKGWTPMHVAADKGRTRSIQDLLRKGANANAITTGQSSPLLLAVQSGHYNAAVALHCAGGKKEIKTPKGSSLLHIAAMYGYAPLARWLLDEIQLDDTEQNQEGWTAYQIAYANGHTQCATILQPPTQTWSQWWLGEKPTREVYVSLDKQLAEPATDLQKLEQYIKTGEIPESIENFEVWLKEHVNDIFDDNAQFKAIHRAAIEGRKEIVKAFLVAGADANDSSHPSPPLAHALMQNRAEAAQMLIDHGAKFDPVVPDSSTNLIHMLASLDMPKFLKEKAALTKTLAEAMDADGNRPIHIAAMHGKTENIKALAHYVDTGAKNRAGKTAEQILVERSQARLAEKGK